jgi:hypothetical protein
MSQLAQRRVGENGVRYQERIARVRAQGTFEILGRLPVIAVAHRQPRREIRPGEVRKLLRPCRRRDGTARNGQRSDDGERSK